MRTTLDLNDTLLARAKAAAVRERTTLTRLIEEGLELRLRGVVSEPKPSRVRLPVYKGRGGLVPGIDPLSNRSLFDATDEGERG